MVVLADRYTLYPCSRAVSVHGPCPRPVDTSVILDARVYGPCPPWTRLGYTGTELIKTYIFERAYW